MATILSPLVRCWRLLVWVGAVATGVLRMYTAAHPPSTSWEAPAWGWRSEGWYGSHSCTSRGSITAGHHQNRKRLDRVPHRDRLSSLPPLAYLGSIAHRASHAADFTDPSMTTRRLCHLPDDDPRDPTD